MFQRLLASTIIARLDEVPCISILGPRQVGKTTLAHAVAQTRPSVHLDLESQRTLQKLQDPEAYFDKNADKLIILDEIQEAPDMFRVLRVSIDKARQSGRGNGRFLILGSASLELLKQSSESLAGRIAHMELCGLLPQEIGLSPNDSLDQLWIRGGFPDSYLARSERESTDWRENFIRTYLERDIPHFGPRVPASTLRRFWTMLAHLHGGMMNASKLATGLDISHTSVMRYLDLLVDLLLIRRLEPWHSNAGKRLVKTPKFYLRDSGILHHLLGIVDLENLLAHPIIGPSWEGFVVENLLAVAPAATQAYFYRTSSGAEIDLLLLLPKQKKWAIEIKRTSAPKPGRGFYEACLDVQPTHRFVVYNGPERYPLPHDTEAINLVDLMSELQQFGRE